MFSSSFEHRCFFFEHIFLYLYMIGHISSDYNMMLATGSTVQFRRSVVSDALQNRRLQHARPLCLSPTPRVYPNSCPLSWRHHPTISSSVVPFSLPSIFPSIRVFSNESAVCIRWPKYWSFSFKISPSNEPSTDLL